MVGLSPRQGAPAGGAVRRHAPARGGGARARHAAEVLLLDEPLSALDALTRAKLQDEIAAHLGRDESKTVVLITNDVDEAILLADRIVPLEPGPRARSARRSACAFRGRATASR